MPRKSDVFHLLHLLNISNLMKIKRDIKQTIIDALQSVNDWIAADDLYVYLRTNSVSISYSTLYKHLRTLRESNIISTQLAHNKTLYLA